MIELNITAIALALGLVFSSGTMAQSMSKNDYVAGKEKIAAEYKAAKTHCASLSGNAGDVCMAEAKGKENVALAELDASYQPSAKSRYQVEVARAEAGYAVAKEKCDDISGNAKDVCVKEAKAAETAAKADAKAKMKTSDARAMSNEKSAEARREANTKSTAAGKDAAADKSDAQYAVAKEKCDTYAGTAKDHCLDQAKAKFGK